MLYNKANAVLTLVVYIKIDNFRNHGVYSSSRFLYHELKIRE